MLYGNTETVFGWVTDPNNRFDDIVRITYEGTVGDNEEHDYWSFWHYSIEELYEDTCFAICPRCGKSAERMGPALSINGIRVCENCYTHYLESWKKEAVRYWEFKGLLWKGWKKLKGKNTRMTENLWNEVTGHLKEQYGHKLSDFYPTEQELLDAINFFAYYFAHENRFYRMSKKQLLELAEEFDLEVDETWSRAALIDEHVEHLWESA